jgi:hypothetical protein
VDSAVGAAEVIRRELDRAERKLAAGGLDETDKARLAALEAALEHGWDGSFAVLMREIDRYAAGGSSTEEERRRVAWFMGHDYPLLAFRGFCLEMARPAASYRRYCRDRDRARAVGWLGPGRVRLPDGRRIRKRYAVLRDPRCRTRRLLPVSRPRVRRGRSRAARAPARRGREADDVAPQACGGRR